VLVAGVLIAWPGEVGLDYENDAGQAIAALARGDLGTFAATQPLMGSVSLLLRAPFVALTGTRNADLAYAAGVLPCLAVLAGLAFLLRRRMQASGHSNAEATLLAALVVLNPASIQAIVYGHPEELLGAALIVLAVCALGDARVLLGGTLLGFAVATKQWALLPVIPVLAAASSRRVVAATTAGAVAAVLTLPLLLANAGRFAEVSRSVSAAPPLVSPASIWWPLSAGRPSLPGSYAGFGESWTAPAWLGSSSHWLIVLVSLAIGAAFVLRRPRPQLSPALDAVAFILLLRCLLDPADNVYYHAPFLAAVVAAEASRGPRAPVVSIVATAGLTLVVLVERIAPGAGALENAVYLSWALPVALLLARRSFLTPSSSWFARGPKAGTSFYR
jgi:Glycosyltransferase family 87